jgi:nitrogen fixation/metabolism regulation signal transduction histidine kinase
VRLVITDNGQGFAPGTISRVFEPYVTTKAKGTGLGLYIVRRSAEELGAMVTYRPRRPKGSIFTVALPER